MIACVDVFTNKSTLLKRQQAREDIAHFLLLKFLGKDCLPAQYYIPSIDRLIEQFRDRFVDFRRYQFEFDLISNPTIFSINIACINLQLELLSLQNDPIIKTDYQTQINKRDLFALYKALPREHYPNLRKRAERMFSLFGRTYICEQSSITSVEYDRAKATLYETCPSKTTKGSHLFYFIILSTINVCSPCHNYID